MNGVAQNHHLGFMNNSIYWTSYAIQITITRKISRNMERFILYLKYNYIASYNCRVGRYSEGHLGYPLAMQEYRILTPWSMYRFWGNKLGRWIDHAAFQGWMRGETLRLTNMKKGTHMPLRNSILFVSVHRDGIRSNTYRPQRICKKLHRKSNSNYIEDVYLHAIWSITIVGYGHIHFC